MYKKLILIVVAGFVALANAQEIVHKDVLRSAADPMLPSYVPATHLTGQIISFGTDTMDDLMRAWIKDFTALYPDVKIELQSKASMSVPAALTAGAAQLSPLSREMNPAEVASFQSKYGYPPAEIKVALGSYRTPTRTVALTFYVNAQNPIARLDFAQLDAMWCTSLKRGAKSEITRWGQLGLTGAWADKPIHLIGVLPPDGVPNFISLRICQGGPLREGISTEKNGGPVSVLTRIVQDVEKDPYAIGYAGFHNILPGTKQVQLSVAPGGPYMKGTFDEVRTARYPMTRYVYIYVNAAPGHPMDPIVQEFLRYVLSRQGQLQIEQEGIFMPLPKAIDAEELHRLTQ